MTNESPQGLRKKVVKGVAWSGVEQWGTQAINFFIFIVLARLLEPESFGLVALATVFTGFVYLFLNQGFDEAIVQHPDLTSEHLDTAFWVNVLIGSLLTCVGILLAKPIAGLFNEPRLAPIIGWMSLSLTIAAFSSTQQAILRRRMNFSSLAKRSLIARTSGGAVGIVAALGGLGVWSLVAKNLVDSLTGVIVLWTASDWRPKFYLSLSYFKELFSFGIFIVGKKLTVFLDTRIDNLLIGYYLGPALLGYYVVAYNLQQIILALTIQVPNMVVLPAFSQLQSKLESLRTAFYRATQFVNLINFPAFFGAVLLAPELIAFLFGPDWKDSVVILQILLCAGLINSLLYVKASLIVALGKPSWLLGVRVIVTFIRVVFFWVAVSQGIIAVALAFFFSTCLALPFYIWVIYKLVDVDLRLYFRQYITPLLGTLTIVVVVGIIRHFLPNTIPVFWQLAIYICMGLLIYLVTLKLIAPLMLQELISYAQIIAPLKTYTKS